MLGTVVTQILKKVGTWKDLCIVKASEFKKLCNNIIAAGIDRMTLTAQYIKSQYVMLKWNIEHLVARLIIAARLTKVEITIALLNLGAHGQQLVTIVRQILQRVLRLLKRGK
jgi:hypothetical protein